MSIKIALAGNPNCGKTTLFNNLTGSNQYVGNWPGVTVEKKEGRLKGRKDIVIQDLPGIYSIRPYTQEEIVTRDFILKSRPDAIINIVDATNIERNLYLTLQLLELKKPVILALNIWLVPTYGYVASAWASVAGYGVITLLSYIIGQKKYPVSYPLKDMAVYLILAAVLFVLSQEVIISNVGLRLVFRTLLLLMFIAYILKKDLPLKTIPFVNRFVK